MAVTAPARGQTRPPPPPLGLPVDCRPGVTCFVQNYVDLGAAAGPRDWACGTRTYREHNGIDFRLPSLVEERRGVDVLAAAPGRVLRLRDGEPDVSVRERGVGNLDGRDCGNGVVVDHGRGWTTQYCHMARGSLRVKAGDPVRAGQPLGQVGLSGRTEYPHLHFTLRHRDAVVEPFAPDLAQGTCGGVRAAAWAPEVAASLPYVQRAVLNAGFAARPVTNEAVEDGTAATPPPAPGSEALIAYVRAIGLRQGDVQRITVTGPGGKPWVAATAEALASDKAQVLYFAGRRQPAGGFAPGTYAALYEVVAEGQVVLSKTLVLDLQSPAPAPVP